jgi:hypothetical protein
MNGHKVNYVPGFTSIRCRRGFVCGKVNWVQYVAEEVIRLGRKKTEVTIGNPFELYGLAETFNLRLTLSGLEFSPRHLKPSVDQRGAIRFGGCHKAFF